MNFVPTEKAFPIRQPSTANLMVDSADRPVVPDLSGNNTISPWDFQITRPNSIMNGYFTRIATTEVVLEWCQDNIVAQGGRSAIVLDVSGHSPAGFNTTPGMYTVEELLDQICRQVSDISGSTGGTICSVVGYGASRALGFNNPVLLAGNVGTTWATRGILQMLDLVPLVPDLSGRTQLWEVQCPDLRPYRYIDFTSADLTYAQELKDTNTTRAPRDVLCRWYFSDDVPEQADGYGFPILMGYRRFCRRRLYNPPKQIRWEPNLPIGNMRFQVYDEDNDLVTTPSLGPLIGNTNWLMTLQVSEV